MNFLDKTTNEIFSVRMFYDFPILDISNLTLSSISLYYDNTLYNGAH